jgi:hypothetical protein
VQKSATLTESCGDLIQSFQVNDWLDFIKSAIFACFTSSINYSQTFFHRRYITCIAAKCRLICREGHKLQLKCGSSVMSNRHEELRFILIPMKCRYMICQYSNVHTLKRHTKLKLKLSLHATKAFGGGGEL